MTRKRKHNEQPRAPGVQNLEALLKRGETTIYGQVCWSVANRGTVRHKEGDIIFLSGWVEEGEQTNEEFLLTRTSIENMARCMEMRTCGEAAALFVEARPIEQEEECAHGHQEAAFAFMMYGIRPTEPCPRCGKIPNFSGVAMSQDFYTDGPIKGADGREYATCPKCGEDFLQLEGESPAEWGWTIACLNCGWEMKQAERLDILQYCQLMEDVKSKAESIEQLLEMPGITIRTRVESICLQLRMLLELIVFSSLISNKDVWQKSKREMQSSQDISKKLRELRRLHPNFYPRPVDLGNHVSGEEPRDRTGGFLSEDRLMDVYGRLGNILHADNPMGKGTNYRCYIDTVPEWISQVKDLLQCHKVYLYHHPQEFYLIKMFGDVDGELLCIPFKTTAEGKTKCAWPDCVSSSARSYCEYLQSPWRECELPEIEPAQAESKRIADDLDDPTEQ